MKLERDKLYRSRCGDVWRVVCVDGIGIKPIVGQRQPNGEILCFSNNGLQSVDEYAVCDNDLISEHREAREVWIGFYLGKAPYDAYEAKVSHEEPKCKGEYDWIKFREVMPEDGK